MAQRKDSKNASEFHGVLLVDKPAGITSHDVVDRVRRLFGTRRVGHTGTLDPQATGLLVLMLGEATKISEYLMGLDKSYEGTLRFGVVSDSYDLDGKVVPGPGGPMPTDLAKVQELALAFVGEIEQVPPAYSAKKIGGRKLYDYARKGDEVPEIPARRIKVRDFEIINLEGDTSEFGVDCSSGTYVRSLVHDLGQKVGCGAILTELRRTDVGPFCIEDARTLDVLQELDGNREALAERVIPIRRALPHFSTVYLVAGAESWIRRGQAVPHSMAHTEDEHRPARGTLVVLCRLDGSAVAIARTDPAPLSPPPRAMFNAMAPWYQPIKQFVTEEAAEEQ